MSAVTVQQSFLDKLTNAIYLDYVLKLLGVVLVGLVLWKFIHGFVPSFMLVAGVLSWFVGAHFTKIYR